jgi:hypothetical protein
MATYGYADNRTMGYREDDNCPQCGRPVLSSGHVCAVVGLEALTAALRDLGKIILQLEARLAGIEAKMGEAAVSGDEPPSSDLDDFICDGCFRGYNATLHGMICPVCGFDNVPF